MEGAIAVDDCFVELCVVASEIYGNNSVVLAALFLSSMIGATWKA